MSEKIPTNVKRFSITISFASALMIGLMLLAVSLTAEGQSPNIPPQVPLGVWVSMPSALTEFMGNASYRQTYVPATTGGSFGGLQAQLSILCLNPSNTAGAFLTLQYALFTISGNIIASGFQQASTNILIDGSGGSCTTNQALVGSSMLLNSTAGQQGYIFRVVGSGGGGISDNPRFSSVQVEVLATARRQAILTIGTHGTTNFVYQAQEIFAVAVSTTITSEWHSTNVTTTGCGVNISTSLTDHCWESGTTSATISVGSTASSTITVTYATSFTGTVNVVMTPTGAGVVFNVALATITLFTAQTLTA